SCGTLSTCAGILPAAGREAKCGMPSGFTEQAVKWILATSARTTVEMGERAAVSVGAERFSGGLPIQAGTAAFRHHLPSMSSSRLSRGSMEQQARRLIGIAGNAKPLAASANGTEEACGHINPRDAREK